MAVVRAPGSRARAGIARGSSGLGREVVALGQLAWDKAIALVIVLACPGGARCAAEGVACCDVQVSADKPALVAAQGLEPLVGVEDVGGERRVGAEVVGVDDDVQHSGFGGNEEGYEIGPRYVASLFGEHEGVDPGVEPLDSDVLGHLVRHASVVADVMGQPASAEPDEVVDPGTGRTRRRWVG
jgi:hypothetical protein